MQSPGSRRLEDNLPATNIMHILYLDMMELKTGNVYWYVDRQSNEVANEKSDYGYDYFTMINTGSHHPPGRFDLI